MSTMSGGSLGSFSSRPLAIDSILNWLVDELISLTRRFSLQFKHFFLFLSSIFKFISFGNLLGFFISNKLYEIQFTRQTTKNKYNFSSIFFSQLIDSFICAKIAGQFSLPNIIYRIEYIFSN